MYIRQIEYTGGTNSKFFTVGVCKQKEFADHWLRPIWLLCKGMDARRWTEGGEPIETTGDGGLDERGGGWCDEWSNSGWIPEAGSTGLTDRLAERYEGKKGVLADSCLHWWTKPLNECWCHLPSWEGLGGNQPFSCGHVAFENLIDISSHLGAAELERWPQKSEEYNQVRGGLSRHNQLSEDFCCDGE